MSVVAWVATVVACGSTPPAPTATSPRSTPVAPPVPMSDPAEYAIDRISRDAGRAIFEHTGLGDPYRTGIPYPMFLAVRAAFPAVFGATPEAFAAKFGFLPRTPDPASPDLDVREGLPVGMHLTIDPLTSVAFVVTNCALCHAERVRWPGGEATVIGLGNKRVRIHAYDAAFAEITTMTGFSVTRLGRLADEAAAARQLAWPEPMRGPLVGATIAELGTRAQARAQLRARTADNPPGRVATIEAFAFALGQLTGQPVAFAPVVGWAKVPDVIGYAQRTTLSWDASGEGPIDLLVVEADLAAGMRVEWLERHPFQGASLGAYLRQPAPRPAFPGAIDRARAERGRVIFDEACAGCHGTYAPSGRVVDYEEAIIAVTDLGTDPARAEAASDDFVRVANEPTLTRGYTRFRRTAGYVPPILTNVWMRAPYGHVGQWPSLAVLATPPASRPTRFVIDAIGPLDLAAVGVPWRPDGPGAVHDGSRPGFAVSGHPYLADLGADAGLVIEYLKTL